VSVSQMSRNRDVRSVTGWAKPAEARSIIAAIEYLNATQFVTEASDFQSGVYSREGATNLLSTVTFSCT